MKAASERIEKFEGIPRKIGDLIFAYFDDNSINLNVLRSVLVGIELSQMNRAFNETVSTVEIKRYILISSGEAIVGNLGGIDSSVEITALGSPVNFLSRLDDATKDPRLSKVLEPGDLVMSESTADVLRGMDNRLQLSGYSLSELGIEIRDFPETRNIFVMKPSEKNLLLLEELYEKRSTEIQSSKDNGAKSALAGS